MEKMGLIGPKPDLRKEPTNGVGGIEVSGFERFNINPKIDVKK